MAQKLVIRKPDRTIHVVDPNNEATLKQYSNRLPVNMRWKFELMDEKDAADLPFIDPHYVTAAEAQTKAIVLEKTVDEQRDEIAKLKEQLALLQKNPAPGKEAEQSTDVNEGKDNKPAPIGAKELIDLIGQAKTAEEVDKLIEGESRVTVLKAAADQKASF